jgi:hypothetical protein
MIRLLERSEIDPVKWDLCIGNALNGSVYNLSWYLDRVSINWSALVENDYESVMPLPWKKVLGVKILYQPFFSRHGGLFSSNLSSDKLSEFISRIPDDFKKIQLCLDHHYTELPDPSFEMKNWIFQELPLEKDMELNRRKYSENTRRLLKKAHDNQLKFSYSDNIESLITFFRTNKGGELTDLKDEHYQRLFDLMREGISHGTGKVGEVRKNNSLIAIGFFWWYRNRVVYLKGTANESGRKLGAMHLMFDEIIQHSCSNHTTLDFGGSRIPGIAGFFHRFGAHDVNYSCLIRDDSPGWFKLGNSIRKSMKI